jgi:hypothetical protein
MGVHSRWKITSGVTPLWSSGQSSWLQIQRHGFDSRRHQIFWEVTGLERGPLSLVSTTEELFKKKCSGSGQENRDYGRRDPSRWSRGNLCPQTLALTLPTSGGHSVGIVHSRTLITEFVVCLVTRTLKVEYQGFNDRFLSNRACFHSRSIFGQELFSKIQALRSTRYLITVNRIKSVALRNAEVGLRVLCVPPA